MPLQATSGTASYDGFGGGVAAVPNYIEDVFSTWLYQGTSANQTITNGIDLSTKGGLVWCKGRPNAGYSHRLFDTARGVNNSLATDLTNAQFTQTNSVTAFNTTGFSLGSDGNGEVNFSGSTYASWTFRKQPKFFDVVTYTGTGVNRQISHSLNSAPACIIVKRTDAAANWQVWHKDVDAAGFGAMVLNSTAAAPSGNYVFRGSSFQTTTEFGVSSNATVNASGGTYVAYLFAHNAGGFGLTGTDNVISCGSFVGTGTANTPTVTLGYEPQWLLIKKINGTISTSASSWTIWDTMRGIATGGNDSVLWANLSDAESTPNAIQVTSTGFQIETSGTFYNESGSTYIYIAIRRGPMKVPTSGTSVYNAIARTGTGAAATVMAGFPVDMVAIHMRNSTNNEYVADRLRGGGLSLEFCTTAAESNRSAGGITSIASNTGFSVGTYSDVNSSPNDYINWCFRRAPNFMDAVCYNRASGATVTHNLGVTPELLIVKRRGGIESWGVMRPNTTGYLLLNATDALSTGLSATATSTTFTLGAGAFDYSDNYVAYLFATLAGVSKVGSYTGNGSSQTINCGFTSGARFVLIKRTDTTGDWYVWDTARGIIAANDPHLSLNTTAAEVTTDDTIDPDSTGFIVNQVAATNVNVTSATYIFFAVA